MPNESLKNGSNKGVTERDAAHIRFRERGPVIAYRCSSCFETFDACNKAEVMEHFVRNVHRKCHSDCLYCNGPVYQYRTINGEALFHHSCLRTRIENDRQQRNS